QPIGRSGAGAHREAGRAAEGARGVSWKNAPEVKLKIRPGAGWTGQEAWVWEGERSPKNPGNTGTVSAGLLDVRSGAWKPFPAGGPPPRRSPRCAWTGKELIVLGGTA